MLQITQEIYTTVIAVSLVIITLSIGIVIAIVSHKRKQENYLRERKIMEEEFEKQLLQSQIEVQESTFSILSKELHDNIGQLLSTAKMLLGITERTILNPPDTLIIANETIGKAINELRLLSKSLSKEWLEQFDLIENLEAEVERVNSAKTMQIVLEHQGKLFIEVDKQIILFRIIQEAIQNTIKHAFAKNVYISIKINNEMISSLVKDDGIGFKDNERPNGVGILNMKHRTKLLGGVIAWYSNDRGSEVAIQLPLNKDKK